ncbi:MAG: type II toxin-antitoxin system RelE/ParE family toxin [Planctomycetes bacterium]|nr:type II toxin-antitoxin system RelE/ParE family toxin [Planctomycetota bacterium]
MTPVTIIAEAEAELREAVVFYETRRPGLGMDFADEAQAATAAIGHAPRRWPLRRDGTRRVLLPRFPYLVIYLIHGGQVWIIAFAHCKRRPLYWSRRVPPK